MTLTFKKRQIAASFFLLVMMSTSVFGFEDWRQALHVAMQYQAEHEYEKAYNQLQKHANKGNGLAQFNLALHEELGWGREANIDNACEWFERAAKSGIPQAMKKAGDCALRAASNAPKAVSQDTAIAWYRAAMAEGIHGAGCSAGKLLIDSGVPKNINEGLALCTQAAEKGSTSAAVLLADLYYHGDLIEQNFPLALRLYQQANPQSNAHAAFQIAIMFDYGLAVPTDLRQSAYWYEVAASQGYQQAYLPLAALYWQLYLTSQQYKSTWLAKSYLWANTSQRLTDDNTADLTILIKRLNEAVPVTWQRALGKKIAEHLNTYHNPDVAMVENHEAEKQTPN
ncbi:sel1 repeat family protein [Aestuariibacter sp. AA17]|uniref:Sel1 repeat family protein n=1 Tax=Fluctibacter corallii TaxID=2984329 RepID=A0ABT3A8X5_9ALTE|nr:tetratricopeptide repeat protein [Aestuariibacter sp. AA17]MCV2885135.1 sel1 repeat family protein [Aestuariibacter sp. AA17]